MLAAWLQFACAAALADHACQKNQNIVRGDGVRLAADCYAGPAAKTLIFIHGWSQAQHVWDRQIRALRAQYRIITFDLRGHGRSAKPATADAFTGRWVHAKDAGAVIDHFGVSDCAIVIGWSFGAVAASDVAVHLGPERICGLIVVSGPVEAATPANAAHFGPLMDETAAMSAGPEGAPERRAVIRFLRRSRIRGNWAPDDFDRLLATNMRLSPADRRRVATRPTYSNVAALNALGIPILLIHGDSDPVFSYKASIAAHQKLNRTALAIYPGIGHWPFIEAAERFNADLKRFAARVFEPDNN